MPRLMTQCPRGAESAQVRWEAGERQALRLSRAFPELRIWGYLFEVTITQVSCCADQGFRW